MNFLDERLIYVNRSHWFLLHKRQRESDKKILRFHEYSQLLGPNSVVLK